MPLSKPYRTIAALSFVFTLMLSGCDGKSFRDFVGNGNVERAQKMTDDEILKMFKEARRICPRRVDPFTTLEDIVVLDDTHIEYRYKVSQQGSLLVQRMDAKALRSQAIQGMRENKMAVAIAEKDLDIQHVYENHAGAIILSYTINKDVLEGREPIGAEQSNPFMTKNVKATSDDNVATPAATGPTAVQPYVPAKRTESNPAGVQGNPFFSG